MSRESVPDEFVDLIADGMRKHGPDGHIDGHETIARMAWEWVRRNGAPDMLAEQEEAVKNAYEGLVFDSQDGNAEALKAAFPSIQWDTP